MDEIRAVLNREWSSESRLRHGLFTSALFSVLAVVAMGFASYGQRPGPTLAAGMLSVTLLFSAVVALPRTFLIEHEQGTFDLLRLTTRPEAAFSGKALYNLIQMSITAMAVATLFSVLTNRDVQVPWLFVLGLVATAGSLSYGVSICSALVITASNRWLLVGAIAVPLLLPQMSLCVGLFRVAFGEGSLFGGIQCLVGLVGYAVAMAAMGAPLAALVWRTE